MPHGDCSTNVNPNENHTEVVLKISDKSFYYSSRVLLLRNGKVPEEYKVIPIPKWKPKVFVSAKWYPDAGEEPFSEICFVEWVKLPPKVYFGRNSLGLYKELWVLRDKKPKTPTAFH